YASVYSSFFNSDVILALISSSAVLFVTSLIILYITVNYGKGRVGRNLFFSYALLNIIGLILAFTIAPYYIITLSVSIIVAVGYTLLRTTNVLTRKKSSEAIDVRNSILTEKANKKVESFIKKYNWGAFKATGY